MVRGRGVIGNQWSVISRGHETTRPRTTRPRNSQEPMNSREKGNPDTESGLRQATGPVRSQAAPRVNSRRKGARGERQWRDELRANGYCARRGQQFCGSAESPDVICDSLPWIHFEVKAVERLNIEDDGAGPAGRREIRRPKPEGRRKGPVLK